MAAKTQAEQELATALNAKKLTIEEHAEQERKLGDEISKLEAKRKEHRIEIEAHLAANGLKKADIGKVSFNVVQFDQTSYDGEKLLLAGVTVDQLEKGKKVTTVTQLRSSWKKEK